MKKRVAKQGMFYLIEFIDEFHPYSHYCKYGVTANPKNRFKNHKTKSGEFKVLDSFFVRDMFFFENCLKFHGCGILCFGEAGIFADNNDTNKKEGHYTIQELMLAIQEVKLKYQFEESKR